MCKYPFVRDPSGAVRWQSRVTREQMLAATPFGCGRCLYCRVNRARVWTTRVMLEMSCHPFFAYITMTYNDDCLPDRGTLVKQDFQKFLKRLRRNYERMFKKTFMFRYFCVGEYGSRSLRPHYHWIFFGFRVLADDFRRLIEKSWNMGFVKVDFDVSFQRVMYLMKYVLKGKTKLSDPRLSKGCIPEFVLSSRKPGIGAYAIDRIARKLLDDDSYDGYVLRSIKIGHRNMPLGRYLIDRFCRVIGDRLDLLAKERLFLSWQFSLLDSLSPYYYEHLESIDALKRESFFHRQSLFGGVL